MVAVTTWITSYGDRLDQICKRHYGTERGRIVERVLDFNRGLEELGPIYDAGVVILLPAFPVPPAPERKIIHLWDDPT